MLPMHQIRAHRMPPTHMPPFVAERIELVKQVILTLEENQPIRVVHPIGRRRKMKLRPKWFPILLSRSQLRRKWRKQPKPCQALRNYPCAEKSGPSSTSPLVIVHNVLLKLEPHVAQPASHFG